MSRFRQRIVSNNNIRDDNYLNFTAVSDQPVIIQRGGENTETVYYTLDNPELDNWIEFDNNSSITLNQYSIIYFKGNIGEQDEIDRANEYMQFLLFGGDVEAHGDVMSIAYNGTLTKNYQFKKLFEQCINLITAPELTATILTEGCYYEMFSECTSLIKAPELKVNIVPTRAYFGMFYKCSNLKETPNLLATQILNLSYARMFEECTSLTKISNLPVQSVPDYAYSMMFRKCTSLKNADISISAIEIGEYGCEYMFSGCYNLEKIPDLNATSLQEYCYFNMFNNCTSLNISKDYILPAEILAPYCYANMFSECIDLTNAPILPSLQLAEGCYYEMFKGCIRLTNSPQLPATTLANYCYNGMFSKCFNLNHVEALFESIENNNSIENWLKESYSTGTIIKSNNADWQDSNVVPTGWSSEKNDSYLTFTSMDDRPAKFKFSKPGLSYSIDNGLTWTQLEANTYTPEITSANKILLKGELIPNSTEGIGTFSSTWAFTARGNIMSLLYGDNYVGQTNLTGKDYAFKNLFQGCLNFITNEIKLPAIILSKECYSGMFEGASIRQGSELPSETLVEGCYKNMFAMNIYLEQPPIIKAETLAKECCSGMFKSCVSLKESPILQAETLVTDCYKEMFKNCGQLSTIEAQFLTNPSDEYTKDWVSEVNNSGIFIKNRNAQWNNRGNNGIPINWETQGDKDESNYLTFTTLEKSKFQFKGNNIQYSLNDGNTWQTLINGQYTPEVEQDRTILWRGNLIPNKIVNGIVDPNYPEDGVEGIGTFSSSGKFNVSGNILSLIYNSNFEGKYKLDYDFIFYKLFSNCKIVSAQELILSPVNLSVGCYYKMFESCNYLEHSPNFDIVNLAEFCYAYMFLDCTSLTDIPNTLPNNKMKGFCYKGMFKNCKSIKKIPLLGKILSYYCYQEMFAECTSLTHIELEDEIEPDPNSSSQDVICEGCYLGMFQDCTNLTQLYNKSGDLLSLNYNLAFSCYTRMFKGCTSLVIAPEMSHTSNGAGKACMEMFSGCKNLEKAPEVLYFNNLNDKCYYAMFQGCQKLQRAPKIYANNFIGKQTCDLMFKDCTSLNYINAPSMIYSSDNTYNWVNNVSKNGKFITNVEEKIYGDNGIPVNWQILNNEVGRDDVLIFNIQTEGNVTIKAIPNLITKNISYSINNSFWNTITVSTNEQSIGGILNPGDILLIKGDNNPCTYYNNGNTDYINFGGTAQVSIEGNIMALVNNQLTISNSHAFYKLFSNYSNLIDCSNLKFPSMTLSNYCYSFTFENCISLKYGPTLLPAIELQVSCYESMFNGCKSLIKAPILPATELVNYCYCYMFYNCENLEHINVSFINWDTEYTSNWVSGVKRNGTFYKDILLSLEEGSSYIPKNWGIKINNDRPVCFKFNNEPGSLTINFTGQQSVDEGDPITWNINDSISPMLYLWYSIDKGQTWEPVTETVTTAISDEIWVHGQGCTFCEYHSDNWWKEYWISFIPNSSCSIEGSILSLGSFGYKNLSNYSTRVRDYGLAHAFDGAINITDASKLLIPVNEVGEYSFMYTFKDCTGLTNPPELSSTKLNSGCYVGMFKGCTSLTTAPELPAINIPSFSYYEMFKGCTNLNHIKAMFTTTPSSSPYVSNTVNWVEGISPTGTFVKNSAAIWDTIGNNGVPNGWTIETANS